VRPVANKNGPQSINCRPLWVGRGVPEFRRKCGQGHAHVSCVGSTLAIR